MTGYTLPRLPVSAGALIWDGSGRILVLRPTYKPGWTVPGGQVEETGESPWEGCQREVREETGLEITSGRLACVDFRRPKPPRPDGQERPGGLRLLFDCGSLDASARAGLILQAEEIQEHRWADPDQAVALLSGPVGRRVRCTLAARAAGPPDTVLYLEDGRPVAGVGGVEVSPG